jgi:hypothetical protein
MIAVFSDMIQYSLVDSYQHFVGIYCLQLFIQKLFNDTASIAKVYNIELNGAIFTKTEG